MPLRPFHAPSSPASTILAGLLPDRKDCHAGKSMFQLGNLGVPAVIVLNETTVVLKEREVLWCFLNDQKRTLTLRDRTAGFSVSAVGGPGVGNEECSKDEVIGGSDTTHQAEITDMVICFMIRERQCKQSS